MKDFDKIIWSDSMTLIDFFATWCGPCKMMHEEIEKFREHMNGRVNVYKIDIDSHEDAEIIRRYNIQSVPTLILFRHGEIMWRGSGRMTYEQMKEVVEMAEQKVQAVK